MIRFIIRCALAPLLSACVLMLSPVASNAESPSTPSAQMIEAKYLVPYQEGEDKIVEPRLGKHYMQLESVERQYYNDLFEITAEVCKQVAPRPHPEHEGYFVETGTQVGFSAQLTKFNTVRDLLNRLLYRFKLGFAPSIEDFSGANELEYYQYPRPHKGHAHRMFHEENGWVEEGMFPGDTDCTLTVVTSLPSVGMK